MKHIKKVVRKIPPLKQIVEDRDKLHNERNRLKSENSRMNEHVKNLEARNDLWEAEVRELRGENKEFEVLWPVAKEDLQKVTQKKIDKAKKSSNNVTNKSARLVLNWVIPPGTANDGGIINIFRFVQFFESKGHTCNVYIYDPRNTNEQLRHELQKSFPKLKTPIGSAEDMGKCDIIFATAWSTAYPVFNFKDADKKYYFVQDFEPYFFPVGAESTFAENTYRFGFHGITAGGWLAQKLQKDYGMKCDYYSFGSDFQRYSYINKQKRKEIFFYARPVTPRRGFELGVAALELFHKKHPDYKINLAGWDLQGYKLPFPYVNLKSLPLNELNDLYNRCATGLVLSFTNMSLLPLELMASGCIPVVNEGDNNRMVSDNPFINYVSPYPQDIADRLSDIVSRDDATQYSEDAAKSAKSEDWGVAYAKVEAIVTGDQSV